MDILWLYIINLTTQRFKHLVHQLLLLPLLFYIISRQYLLCLKTPVKDITQRCRIMSTAPPSPQHGEGFSAMIRAEIKPGRMDEFLSLFYAGTEKLSQEPECLSFEVFRSKSEPNKLMWIESWSKGMEWFMEHQMSKDYMKELHQATKDLCAGEQQVEIYERFGGPWAKAREAMYEQFPSA